MNPTHRPMSLPPSRGEYRFRTFHEGGCNNCVYVTGITKRLSAPFWERHVDPLTSSNCEPLSRAQFSERSRNTRFAIKVLDEPKLAIFRVSKPQGNST